MKKTVLLVTVLGTLGFANSGEALIKEKCATCHTLEIPQMEMMPEFVAPPMDAVMFHMKDVIKGKENLKAFIDDYVYDPDVSKSVCESNKVQKFGVMPSQKGKVSKEELSTIADYMIDTYPREQFVRHLKEMLKNDQMTALKASPFLINAEYLPHFTKMLIEHWDKAKLGLTDDQKKKLLVVRKETVSGVKKIKKQTTFIEFEVAEAMLDRESVESVQKQLDELAALKKEATNIHLKCISDTTSILNDAQLEYLLPTWQ